MSAVAQLLIAWGHEVTGSDSRPDWPLAEIAAHAGTHGKTTTTGLVWSALRAGGLDPSLICGGELVDLGTNAYAGKGEHLVIEADEYDHAFLALDPAVAVATNVDHDHVDMFPTREDV